MTSAAMGAREFHDTYHRVRRELGRVIVGQDRVLDHLLTAVFAGGHVLLTGLPGLGRTLLVKSLADALGLEFRRLQFTPDMLPTDILGAEVLESHVATGRRTFRFFKGPVFAHLVLADEVNRSPARTQSALLEVMQERQVTVAGRTHFLPQPFILVATENTLDSEGVWNLGEAQTDRFLMCIEQEYPDEAAERRMVKQTTGSWSPRAERVAGPETVLAMQRFVREVPVVPSVRDFALALVRASRPGEKGADPEAEASLRLGASPRGAQALLLAAKVTALARGRRHVARQDVADVAQPVLAHRLLMDWRAKAEGRRPRDVVERIVLGVRQKTLGRTSYWTREVLRPGLRP